MWRGCPLIEISNFHGPIGLDRCQNSSQTDLEKDEEGSFRLASSIFISARVTRLGEFSPAGRLLSFGNILKTTKEAPILLFLVVKYYVCMCYVSVLTNNGLGYFLGVFSLNHLVTLISAGHRRELPKK
jgi:hypothetical protein